MADFDKSKFDPKAAAEARKQEMDRFVKKEAKGYYQVEENRIAVQEGMSEAQTVKTALHEASHASLHNKEAMNADSDKKSRNQKECEAKSVAYVVCQHYGIDTAEYSFPYVAGWSSDKEVPELKASLDTIRRAASDLIVKIDEKIAELTQGQEKNQFAEIDQWIAEHGDELPFDSPEANHPAGYIKITPPVDMSSLKAESPKKMDFKIQFSGRNRYIKFSEYGFKMNILLYTRGQVVIQLDEMFNGKFEQQIYEFTEDETEQEQFLVRIIDILEWMLPIFCDKAVVDAHTFTDYLRDDIETAIENVKVDWKNYGDREF